MISVVLNHPNGQRQDVILADVPRTGDHVRLQSAGPDSPSLVVEHVLWLEVTGPEPSVVVVVRPHVNGPRA